jgi:hypothetical protein
MTMNIKVWQPHWNVWRPKTLVGFEPGIFYSWGGRDDHETIRSKNDGYWQMYVHNHFATI